MTFTDTLILVSIPAVAAVAILVSILCYRFWPKHPPGPQPNTPTADVIDPSDFASNEDYDRPDVIDLRGRRRKRAE